MEIGLFVKGAIIGFSIAAPVGPIGILCIRKTLQHGRLSGLFSGLGAAIADGLYGIIAAFGLTLISDFLIAEQFWLRLIGGTFLLYLGIKTFFAKAKEKSDMISHGNLFNDCLFTFFLTMTNPMTILSYLAVFASVGISPAQNTYFGASKLAFGVFIGAALWWLMLSEGVTLFRKKVTTRVMVWINRAAGLIITTFGLVVLVSLIFLA